MTKSKYVITKSVFRTISAIALAVIMMAVPLTVYADNTARQNNHFTNPNWQNMRHTNNWNWRHNWAYQAPEYQFETTFPVDQWGRPTTSNVAPQHTQNIRRDRHAAALPPSHGHVTGFFSGEFPTGQVNPFAPRYNNNPAASHAIAIEGSPFALLPGETGVNVRADGSHAGGFLASTGGPQQGGAGAGAPHGGPVGSDTPPWTNPGNQAGADGSGQGFTVTHRPIENNNATQSSTQQGRIITVTPFPDGTIGRITIPALNRTASVRPGTALPTLDHYVGHFSYTSMWDGNIALASHNRGPGSFFAGIWTLQRGDRVYYETTLGVRVFEVASVEQIRETDLANLDHTHENSITLVTCVYGQSALRWSIVGRQVE